MALANSWDFRIRSASGPEWRGVSLTLEWSLPETAAVSDSNTQEDMSARQALSAWLERLDGATAIPISWAVADRSRGIHEKAPFCPPDANDPAPQNFLTFYTWPVHTVTAQRLLFTQLPVADETWEQGLERGKAGFVQAATGWKPSPLQQTMDLQNILAAAGL